MNSTTDEVNPWDVRAFVYHSIVEHGRPPSTRETADAMGVRSERILAAYRDLHRHHALLLDHDGETIRMANPFSGVPTSYHVHVNDHSYWANCAWDALGIPAALHTDARIDAVCAETGEPMTITVEDGQPKHNGGVIHFLLPFSRWYDDLIKT